MIEKPQIVKPFGSHCHERVYMALEKLERGTKAEIADFAQTTEAVVSNAFHDWKRGKYTRDGEAAFACIVGRNNKKAIYQLPND